MSRKIIGVTVGTQLPKPNFKQEDPTKGDYIKNKPDFEGLKSQVNTIGDLVGDTKVATQIDNAIDALNLDTTYAQKSHAHTMSDVTGLSDALAGKQAVGDYATKTEAKSYADAKDSAIATAKSAGDNAQSDLDAYKTSNDAAVAAVKSTADKAVVANSKITGATKTKITYDSKGLVTGGADLSASDIPTLAISKISGLQSTLDAKQDDLVFNTTYNASTNKVATMYDVNAVEALIGDESVATQIGDAVETLEAKIATKSDSEHSHDDKYYTESEVDSKLGGKSDTGHTHSAYVNQNAFSNVVVGSTTIAADSTTDTLTLVAGSNVTLTPDASGDKITIAAKDTTYTHPTSGVTAGTYKSVTVNAQGHVTAGTNPTTLSGYGITDAATKTELKAVSDLVGDTKVSTQISNAIANKSDVGHNHDEDYDARGAADTALASAKTYADQVKNDLLNGAGTAYDTLKELGDLIDDNQDAIEALETVAASKADASTLTSHTGNKSNPHGVTATQVGAVPTSRTVNGKALSANITLSASDVGADASGAANTALTNAKAYTDAEITEWVGDKTVSEQISTAIAGKSDSGHTHDDRYYTESEINTKLSGKADTSHTHSSYVNQNAFSNVKVGTTTIAADTTTDTLTLVAGSNITITPDATNDKITIAATDTVYTHPNSGVSAGTYRSVTVNAQGHVIAGSNPTTLSGYGITDAVTKTELNTVLPSVTNSDNGKLLMVVDGAWKAVTAPTYTGTVEVV